MTGGTSYPSAAVFLRSVHDFEQPPLEEDDFITPGNLYDSMTLRSLSIADVPSSSFEDVSDNSIFEVQTDSSKNIDFFSLSPILNFG